MGITMGFLVIPQLSQEAGAGSVAQPGGRLWASQGLGDQEPRAANGQRDQENWGIFPWGFGSTKQKIHWSLGS